MADFNEPSALPAWVHKFDQIGLRQFEVPRTTFGQSKRYDGQHAGTDNPTYESDYKLGLRQPAFSQRGETSYHQPLPRGQPGPRPLPYEDTYYSRTNEEKYGLGLGAEADDFQPDRPGKYSVRPGGRPLSSKDELKPRSTRKRVCIIVTVIVVILLCGAIAAALTLTLIRPDSDEKIKNVVVSMSLHADDEFETEYKDSNSTEYVVYATKICTNMTKVFDEFSSVSACKVNSLQNGSVIVDFSIFFREIDKEPSKNSVTEFLNRKLVTNPDGSSSLEGIKIIKGSSIIVTEIEKEVKDDDLPPEFTSRPDVSPTTTQTTTEAPQTSASLNSSISDTTSSATSTLSSATGAMTTQTGTASGTEATTSDNNFTTPTTDANTLDTDSTQSTDSVTSSSDAATLSTESVTSTIDASTSNTESSTSSTGTAITSSDSTTGDTSTAITSSDSTTGDTSTAITSSDSTTGDTSTAITSSDSTTGGTDTTVSTDLSASGSSTLGGASSIP